jgi:hypothetical protein
MTLVTYGLSEPPVHMCTGSSSASSWSMAKVILRYTVSETYKKTAKIRRVPTFSDLAKKNKSHKTFHA